MNQPPAEYVAARRTLLDALDALGPHRASVVLIGAQAVYLHTGSGTLAIPPMTTDADLALDGDLLADDPDIAISMQSAGFKTSQPGHWMNLRGIAVDIMVAPHQSNRPPGSRAADLTPHGKSVARIGGGLAPALIDNKQHVIAALETGDSRSHDVRVAGPGALLVAKTIKIGDRLNDAYAGKPGRIVDKDALDVLRLLQAHSTEELSQGLKLHPQGSPAHGDVMQALEILRSKASRRDQEIPLLAATAALGDPTVAASLAVLVQDLLADFSGVSRASR
ncbi:MAG: hypothetical protein ABIW49_11040 [Knoellia sp.]